MQTFILATVCPPLFISESLWGLSSQTLLGRIWIGDIPGERNLENKTWALTCHILILSFNALKGWNIHHRRRWKWFPKWQQASQGARSWTEVLQIYCHPKIKSRRAYKKALHLFWINASKHNIWWGEKDELKLNIFTINKHLYRFIHLIVLLYRRIISQ